MHRSNTLDTEDALKQCAFLSNELRTLESEFALDVQGAQQSGLPDRANAEPEAARPEGKRLANMISDQTPVLQDDSK